MRFLTVAALLLGASSGSLSAEVPAEILRQIPSGYAVMTSAQSSAGGRTFYIVALRSQEEPDSQSYGHVEEPVRPLLIFERAKRGVMQVGRNDHVIDRVFDAGLSGNLCDPFEQGRIAVKGAYFTVENSVACGNHWTDYVTFRFDPRVGYVFDNWRFQSWKFNQSDDPHADALVPDVQHVVRASRRPVPFPKWQRPR